jgi:hypothetical protein
MNAKMSKKYLAFFDFSAIKQEPQIRPLDQQLKPPLAAKNPITGQYQPGKRRIETLAPEPSGGISPPAAVLISSPRSVIRAAWSGCISVIG